MKHLSPNRKVLAAGLLGGALVAAVLGCNWSAGPTPSAPTAVLSALAGLALPPPGTSNVVAWGCLSTQPERSRPARATWSFERETCPSTLQRVETVHPTAAPVFAPAPTNLRAAVNGTTVQLQWDQAEAANAWQLEAGSSTGLSDVVVFRTTTGTTLTVTGVPPGLYFVRVRSASPDFEDLSVPSNEVIVIAGTACSSAPAPPIGLGASVAGNNVGLSWAQPPGTAPTSFVIEVGTASGLSNVLVHDTGAASTSLQGVAPAGVYFVRVRARHACGTSGPSNEVTVYVGVLPAPPLAAFRLVRGFGLTSPEPQCSYRACEFDGSASTGTGLTYLWDFADGATGSGPFVIHTYARPETRRQFTVVLTVTDAFGRISTKAMNIYLQPNY